MLGEDVLGNDLLKKILLKFVYIIISNVNVPSWCPLSNRKCIVKCVSRMPSIDIMLKAAPEYLFKSRLSQLENIIRKPTVCYDMKTDNAQGIFCGKGSRTIVCKITDIMFLNSKYYLLNVCSFCYYMAALQCSYIPQNTSDLFFCFF